MTDSGGLDIEVAGVLSGVPHGFFGHGGGRYQFGYGGPGDYETVRATRAAAADAIMAGAPCVTPHQVHSPDVVIVTQAWDDVAKGRPVADAVVTNQSGIVLGIVTADCGPVLFADAEAGIVGAAHAGWRGAHGGVIENTVAAMEALGAARANIVAAIGPTIAQASYEVDARFHDQFAADDAIFFKTAPERDGSARWRFDLPAYIAEKLRVSGLRKIESLDRDTFSHSERYYSYRRAAQRGEPNYGRQISMIAVN